MNLQQAQVNINLLKPHLESAKTPQQKAIILSQIKRYESLLNKAKIEQSEQFWKDLVDREKHGIFFASARCDQCVVFHIDQLTDEI